MPTAVSLPVIPRAMPSFDERHATIAAMLFLQLHGTPEPHDRGTARLVARHAATDVFFGKHLDVRAISASSSSSRRADRVSGAKPGEQDNESRQHGVTGRRAAASAS
jgi:hypothetical protein